MELKQQGWKYIFFHGSSKSVEIPLSVVGLRPIIFEKEWQGPGGQATLI